MGSDPFAGVPVQDELPFEELKNPFIPATPNQLRYIDDLIVRKQVRDTEAEVYAGCPVGELDKEGASRVIDWLKNLPNPQHVTEDVPEGIHEYNGTIYKVQVAHQGSGKKYAKRLVNEPQGGGGSWEYEGRAPLRLLSAGTLMTLDKAREFGKLYGFCVRCGAILTDEVSIARGIGPVCEGYF